MRGTRKYTRVIIIINAFPQEIERHPAVRIDGVGGGGGITTKTKSFIFALVVVVVFFLPYFFFDGVIKTDNPSTQREAAQSYWFKTSLSLFFGSNFVVCLNTYTGVTRVPRNWR